MTLIKAIILAAGYGTRLVNSAKEDKFLTEDLRNEITLNPKPLLHLGKKRIIEIILEKIENISEIDQVIVVTNHTYYKNFDDWKKNFRYNKSVLIIDDGAISNETRLGAIKDLMFAIKKGQINDDILILGGDTIADIEYKDFINFFKEKHSSATIGADCFSLEKAKHYGVITVNKDCLITGLYEKPNNPKSTLVAPCTYILKKEEISLIDDYLKHYPKSDAPGYFLEYLIKKNKFYAYILNKKTKWFDIGSLETYKKAFESYS